MVAHSRLFFLQVQGFPRAFTRTANLVRAALKLNNVQPWSFTNQRLGVHCFKIATECRKCQHFAIFNQCNTLWSLKFLSSSICCFVCRNQLHLITLSTKSQETHRINNTVFHFLSGLLSPARIADNTNATSAQ